MLSSVPQGISGFVIDVSMGGTIAEVLSVTFPPYGLALTNPSTFPASIVSLSAADLTNIVQATTPGPIELASLQVIGLAPGVTSVTVTVVSMDDDSGQPMSVAPASSPLTVTS